MPIRLLLCVLVVLSFDPSLAAEPPSEAPGCDLSPSECLIIKYWPESDTEALRVAECESHYDPHARRSGSQYTGVFQIGVNTHAERIARLGYSEGDMYDAGKNTVVAADLHSESGWGPWECKP